MGCVIWAAVGSFGFAEQSLFERQLSVAELAKVLNDDDWIVVDARSTDAYNGWALDNLDCGGHIPGAVDFPADWLEVDVPGRTDKLTKILQTKGILTTRKIVIYDLQKGDRQQVARFLQEHNFKSLYSFDLRDWLESQRKLKRHPQYQRLVPPLIAKQLLDGNGQRLLKVPSGLNLSRYPGAMKTLPIPKGIFLAVFMSIPITSSRRRSGTWEVQKFWKNLRWTMDSRQMTRCLFPAKMLPPAIAWQLFWSTWAYRMCAF